MVKLDDLVNQTDNYKGLVTIIGIYVTKLAFANNDIYCKELIERIRIKALVGNRKSASLSYNDRAADNKLNQRTGSDVKT